MKKNKILFISAIMAMLMLIISSCSQPVENNAATEEKLVAGATISNIVKKADFDSGNVYQNIFTDAQMCLNQNKNAAVISDSFARNGKKSLRLEIKTTDADCGGAKRVMEYVSYRNAWANVYDQRLAFSTYMPTWCPFDVRNELEFQWHVRPARDTLANPVVALWQQNGKWVLRHTFDTINFQDKIPYLIKNYVIGDVVKGKWDDWVFMANFRIDKTGFIKVYRNGILVVDIKGANFNNESGKIQAPPVISIGLYKFGWPKPPGNQPIPKRVMYYDRIRFGSPAANYYDLSKQ